MARPKKEVTRENIEKFQKELELAGNRTDILLKDKKGRSKSCLLCRRRKQRCDHRLPSCTACLKAGVKCIQPARYLFAKNNNISSSKDGSRKRYEGTNKDTSTVDVTADSSVSVSPETSASTIPQKMIRVAPPMEILVMLSPNIVRLTFPTLEISPGISRPLRKD